MFGIEATLPQPRAYKTGLECANEVGYEVGMSKNQFPAPPFSRPWDITGAVARLLLSDEKFQIPTLLPVWRTRVEEWVRGVRTHSLHGLGLPHEASQQLAADLDRIKTFLEGLRARGWKQPATMLSVVWIRLFSEAGVRMSRSAAAAFALWKARGLEKQAIWLCQHRGAGNRWHGPRKFKAAPTLSLGLFTDELLWGPPPSDAPLWPYDRPWRLVLRRPFKTDRTLPGARNVEQAKRKYGGQLVETMRKLVIRAKSDMPAVLQAGKDRLKTSLSLKELAEEMKKRYKKELKSYSETSMHSMKGALRPFVQAPRGKPKPGAIVK